MDEMRNNLRPGILADTATLNKFSSFLHQLRAAMGNSRNSMRGSFDWRSTPYRRTSRGKQPAHSEFLIPDFSEGKDFSPGLYASLRAFDVEDLGFHFRFQQWGSGNETGGTAPSDYVRMVYTFPHFKNPTKAIELEQVDIAEGSKRAQNHQLSDEGRQEALLLSLNRNLYAPGNREQWFHHMDKQVTTLDAIPKTSAVLDYWRGPKRSYCIMRVFVGDVRIQALLSGFDDEEAVSVLGRLAPIASNERLAEWHDATIGEMRSVYRSLEDTYGERRH